MGLQLWSWTSNPTCLEPMLKAAFSSRIPNLSHHSLPHYALTKPCSGFLRLISYSWLWAFSEVLSVSEIPCLPSKPFVPSPLIEGFLMYTFSVMSSLFRWIWYWDSLAHACAVQRRCFPIVGCPSWREALCLHWCQLLKSVRISKWGGLT